MKELLFKLAGLLLLVGSLLVGWQWMRYQNFADQPLSVGEDGIDVVLERGSSLRAFAQQLQARGALEDPRLLVLMGRLRSVAGDIKAGEYHIEPGTTPPELLQQLVAGRVRQYGLTVVEGWTFAQMMNAINAEPRLAHTLEGLEPGQIMERLGYGGLHPEGRFLPETYYFPQGMEDAEFLRRAYQAMEARLAAEWEERASDLPYDSPYEALVMASIIEKETGVPDERSQIAGVFVRRLQKRMRLQTDPTVIYGLGQEFDGNLRRRDLRASDNPYNTYRHGGLPPTPIALPGADAIHAALHPADGDSLYFVSRGDGSHIFSATLEEHNKAVIRYQLNGRKRPFSSYSGK